MNPEDRYKEAPWWIVLARDHAGNSRRDETVFVAGARNKEVAQSSCQSLNTSAMAMEALDRYRAIERATVVA